MFSQLFLRFELWLERLALPKEERSEAEKRHQRYCFHCKWNRPILFRRVLSGDGMPVGESLDVEHRADPYEQHTAILWVMTDEVLRRGVKANAFHIVDTKPYSDPRTLTTIQPVWVAGVLAP